MQSLRARQEYRNALHCAYRIATEEGVLNFWKGTVPRLGRLIVSYRSPTPTLYSFPLPGTTTTFTAVDHPDPQLSGGIVFTVYEKAYPVFDAIM